MNLFKKKWFGGLDPEHVQDHLDKLYSERREYQQKTTKLETQLKELEGTLKEFEAKEKAMKETVNMVDAYAKKVDQEAQARKAFILESAKKESQELVDRAKEQKFLIEKEILRLHKQKQVVLSDIQGICHRHLSLVRSETVKQDSLLLMEEEERADHPKDITL